MLQFDWLIDFLQGGAMLVLGAVVSVAVERGWSALELRRGRDIRGKWLSEWRLQRKDGETIWVKEIGFVKRRFGRLYFCNEGNERGYQWEGWARIYKANFVYGYWRTRRPESDSKGTFQAIISVEGNYMFGSFTGVDDKNVPVVIATIFAREEAYKRRAKSHLKNWQPADHTAARST